MIDISAYRQGWGETRRAGLFGKGAQNLVVKLLEVSVPWRRTLWRGRGCDCWHMESGGGLRAEQIQIQLHSHGLAQHMTSQQLHRSLMSPKRTSSVLPIHTRKPPFGSRKVPPPSVQFCPLISHLYLRFLTENTDVWSQNAWDHVPPPADQHATIAASLARQHAAPVPDADKHKYNSKPAKHWFV